MEQHNIPISENMEFADLIHSVGEESIQCGNKLQSSSVDIHMACHSTDSIQLSSNLQIVSPQNNVTATAQALSPQSTQDNCHLKAVSSKQLTVNSGAKCTE